MLTIVLMLILGMVGFGLLMHGFTEMDNKTASFGGICMTIAVFIFVYGCFNGYIDRPKTEGVHQGIITAVDLEGIYFRRYEVYLKSSGFTGQSDETKYCIYEYETELAEQLHQAIGKTVKLYYGHDGGKINWKSCGTWHLKSVEILKEVN